MSRVKPKGKYQAISVPTALLKDIKDYVMKSNYNSIAEFVKESVREQMSNKSQDIIVVPPILPQLPQYLHNCPSSKHLSPWMDDGWRDKKIDSTDALDMDKMIQKQNQMLDQQNQMLDQLEKRNNELHQLQQQLERRMEIWKPPKTQTLAQDLAIKRGTHGAGD